MASNRSGDRPDGVAFLLAQLGHHAATLFAEQVATLGLTPAHAGILRAIAAEPGRSQQALSAQLGMLPSRVVVYVDELEDGGFLERRRNPGDRRLHALHLTTSGKGLLRKVSGLARQHELRLTAALDPEQCGVLRELLIAVANQQGLTPHVHPGYRTLGNAPRERRAGHASRVTSTTTSRSVAPSPE
ncbi:MarR family winged helix-turn-helix transcriptional regulator [Mycobacterium parmense]|uniref:MarR family winged helix-turn-helix transcriptional regulator n=1 Tax=Mycobacterium parmense TaxID=185642 RepID=UPI001E4F53B2|nr:MarR family winged helix-turn-helix transcriptional regulator [Mycobacterium parmense]